MYSSRPDASNYRRDMKQVKGKDYSTSAAPRTLPTVFAAAKFPTCSRETLSRPENIWLVRFHPFAPRRSTFSGKTNPFVIIRLCVPTPCQSCHFCTKSRVSKTGSFRRNMFFSSSSPLGERLEVRVFAPRSSTCRRRDLAKANVKEHDRSVPLSESDVQTKVFDLAGC